MSRPNGYTSYRGSSREIRPTSAELVDLHVYIVPPEIWRERYNNFLNQNVTETISAGIIRVHPERVLYDLRDELEQQVGVEMLPRDFVFLKSVGRSITRLKQKQEYQLKAKHFIPPQAYAPELYLLEVSPDDRESSRTSTRPQSPFSQNPEKISQVKKAIKPKDSAKAILTKKEKSRPAKFRKDETQRRMKMNSQEICEDERRSGNKSKHRHNQSSPYHYSPLPKIRSGRSPSRRVEYNHNGDIKAESQRLTDSWGSNRDKHTPPPPQNVPRTPPRPKVSREHTPRNQTPRDESHRAPPRYSTTPTDHRKRADQSREPASGTYTNHTNEDSGINVNSPVDHFDALDRRKQEEDRRDDLHQRLHPNNEDDHQRNGDQNDDDWERRRREDEERRRREEEERRRREEEERRREEEERHRLEEERDRIPKQQLTGSDEVSTVSSENTPIASNEGSRTTTGGKQYQQSPSSAFTENSLNSNKRGNPSINRNSENYNRDQRRDQNSENYSRDQRRDRNSENYSRDQRGNPTRDQNYSDNYNREQWGDTSINQNSENYNREQRGNPLINQNSGNYNRGKGGNHSVNPNSGNFNREQDRYPGINQDSENYHSDHSQPYSDNSVHSHKDRMKVPGGTDKDFGNSYNNKGRKKDPQNSGNSMNYSQDRLKIPETDARNQIDDTPLSQYEENFGRISHINDFPREGTKPVLKDSNVVVQINDEIHGKLTPRVIVKVNSGSSNRTIEEESYRRNRLKMGDNGYHSDHDWDARSVRSFRSDGYLSDATSHRSRPPVNDRTFVNPENSKNDRRSVENHKTFAENDRKSVVGREETNSHSNYKTENNGKNSERRSSLVNGNSVIQSVREEDTERRGKRSSAGKKKEVSWSDKGRPEDKKEDLNTNNNRSDQRDTPNIITETVAEASEGKGLQSSAQLSDHVKEPRNSANGVKSGSTHPELEIVTESTSAKETERAAVENPAKSTYRGSEAGEVLRSKIGTESSFEKSEADTLISNVNSGYQGDVSDIGADEKTDSNNRLKKPKDLNRFPSPPPLQINDSSQGHETESSKQNKKAEKERLLKELEAAREARRAVEKQREELVKKAKLMQTKTQNRRNHARDLWKKRYFEEKKKTPPLEEQCNRLRHELDIIHRKLMNTLEGPSKEKSTRLGDLKPSQKNNYKIQATRLTHEIDDMRRRLENAKMKLTAEMKLRNQAETELRALRAELTQQKIQLTLSRKEQLAKLTPTTHDSRLLTSSYS